MRGDSIISLLKRLTDLEPRVMRWYGLSRHPRYSIAEAELLQIENTNTRTVQNCKDNKTEDDTETYDGLITDISGGGMGLLTDEELDVGTRIECSISVQDMLDVTVQGLLSGLMVR